MQIVWLFKDIKTLWIFGWLQSFFSCLLFCPITILFACSFSLVFLLKLYFLSTASFLCVYIELNIQSCKDENGNVDIEVIRGRYCAHFSIICSLRCFWKFLIFQLLKLWLCVLNCQLYQVIFRAVSLIYRLASLIRFTYQK